MQKEKFKENGVLNQKKIGAYSIVIVVTYNLIYKIGPQLWFIFYSINNYLQD